jgi:hypothetical protein
MTGSQEPRVAASPQKHPELSTAAYETIVNTAKYDGTDPAKNNAEHMPSIQTLKDLSGARENSSTHLWLADNFLAGRAQPPGK